MFHFLIHRLPQQAPRLAALFAVPSFAAAQTLSDIIVTVGELLDALIPMLVTLAVVFFFWGIAKYILQADNPEGRASARQIMLWGIIALFVMVSVWGLVALLAETFGIQQGGTIDLPGAPS